MTEMKGRYMVETIRKRWISYSIIADILIAGGYSFIIAILTAKLFNWSYGWLPVYFFILTGILFLLHRAWLVQSAAIARFLNEAYPQLEESTELLLQPAATLNLLEQLQQNKTSKALLSIKAPLHIARKLIKPAVITVLMLIAGLLLYKIPFYNSPPSAGIQKAVMPGLIKKEIILPEIAGAVISIHPPAYTGRQVHKQPAFNLQAEEGSIVEWKLQTNVAAAVVQIIFNDTRMIKLHPADDHTGWYTTKKIDSSGFYQVNIDGHSSELYTIETIKDLAPVILLQSPKQYTTIDIGERQVVSISGNLSDDYGIKDASITATIASGSGEAVKFKEQHIPLQGFTAGRQQYQLRQLLLLPQLGMQPGDELYFYLQATDNHFQQTRSDIYIVHLPDTAQLMGLDGMANGISLKPEYFRSQRQIIIETEQLLKDKDTISESSFKERSNNLGIDQKLLRLRYGKFLGDEAESGDVDAHDLEDISNFSNADKVRDAYTDKHDNAEDAGFYDAATKKQLRATLAQMWNAEVQLRTFLPQAALPVEYKALRLLKDLQQKSRAYVAKTNFKTTPLDLKKRLTGDISKINPAVLQKDIRQMPDHQILLSRALAELEAIRAGSNQQINAGILQQASISLHEKAIRQPDRYLIAMKAMKKIMNATGKSAPVSIEDVLKAEHGIQQLLAVPAPMPAAAQAGSKEALSKQYFISLQKKQP